METYVSGKADVCTNCQDLKGATGHRVNVFAFVVMAVDSGALCLVSALCLNLPYVITFDPGNILVNKVIEALLDR